MCESEPGLISPRTRQNAGTSTDGAGIPGGSVKGPAATLSADRIDVSVNFKPLSLSQAGCAWAAAEAAAIIAAIIEKSDAKMQRALENNNFFEREEHGKVDRVYLLITSVCPPLRF
jgi:hypothetical protein